MKKIRLSVLTIMIGTFLSKVLGLLRDVILAANFGANTVSDAYLISTTIPSLIVGAIATAILSTYIPVLNSALKENEEAAEQFNNTAISFSLIIVTMLVLIFFMVPDFIVSLFVIGFSDSSLDLVVNMTKITIFMSYFLVLISIFSSYLQNQNLFKATSFNGLIFNSISILGILLSARYNAIIMAYTFVIGYIIATIHLFYQAYKCGLRIKLNFDYKNKYIKKLLILTLPVILNSVVWDVNVMIDKTLTSTIGAGYVSGLNYSFKIINVATDIIAVSIATFIFPKISKFFQLNDSEKLLKIFKNSMNLVILLLIPIAFAIFEFAEPIVKILFMRGNFNEFALNITTNSLKLYVILLPCTGINIIIYKYFNAIELNNIPAKNALVSVIFNIILNLIFIKYFGYKGVIMATVISTWIASLMIMYKLKINKIPREVFFMWIKTLSKSLIASFISINIGSFIFNCNFIVNSMFFNLLLSGIIFLVIYLCLLILLGLKINDVLI